jgi:hypothetical protein
MDNKSKTVGISNYPQSSGDVSRIIPSFSIRVGLINIKFRIPKSIFGEKGGRGEGVALVC